MNVEQNIDPSDATVRLLFNMLCAIAQFETELHSEQQMDGIRKAKERGAHFGPKKKLTPEQITELQGGREQGALIKTLMRDYSTSKVSVYRHLAQTDSSPSVV